MIFLEVIKELEGWLVNPLVDFEEMFVVAQVSSIVSTANQNVIVLHALFKFYTVSIDDWVIFSVIKHSRHFDSLHISCTRVLVLIFFQARAVAQPPVELVVKLMDSFQVVNEILHIKII